VGKKTENPRFSWLLHPTLTSSVFRIFQYTAHNRFTKDKGIYVKKREMEVEIPRELHVNFKPSGIWHLGVEVWKFECRMPDG